MARICIVTTRNIFDSPCLGKYESLIKEPYDIIYWDRCNIEEECGAKKYYRYLNVLEPGASKLKKLRVYIGYFFYVNYVLLCNQYERVIVYPTQAAWIISCVLLNKYKGRYLFDIRDYAGENNFFIKKLTAHLVKDSGLTSLTSPKYKSFLPEHDYVISHNIQPIDERIVKEYRHNRKCKETKYNLAFIGSVRFIDQQKKLISALANDDRFLLRYIGRGSEQLLEFCKEEKIRNVELIGQFERDQLASFYMDTDMAINVYGNNNPYLDYALSNKLYSAAIMGMPILVSNNTYMEEVSKKYGFGLAFDFENCSMSNELFKYLRNIDNEEIIKGCDTFMREVFKDEITYEKKVEAFLNQF